MRISFNEVMAIGFDALTFKSLFKGDGRWLTIIVCDDNRAHHESPALELISQSQHVLVVRDAQVGALLLHQQDSGTDNKVNLNPIR